MATVRPINIKRGENVFFRALLSFLFFVLFDLMLRYACVGVSRVDLVDVVDGLMTR